MTNKKSHTPFRLVPKSTTLDDLQWPIRTLLQKVCVFRAHHKNLKEDRLILPAAKMLASYSSFWWYKVYADIRKDSLERGVKRQWGCQQRQFSAFSLAIFRKLEVRPAVFYNGTQSAVSFSVVPKCVTLNDPEWLLHVKFCFCASLSGSDCVTFEKIIAWKLIKIDTLCQQRKSAGHTYIKEVRSLHYVWCCSCI